MIDLLIRLLTQFWNLLPALALVSGLVLLVTSRVTVRHFSSFAGGPDSPTTWVLLVGILGLLVLSGALERRVSGASPLLALPVVGQFLAPLQGPRLSYLICLLASLAVLHALTRRSQARVGSFWLICLTGWAVLTVVVTAIEAEDPPDHAMLDLAATALAFAAVLLLACHLTEAHLRSVLALHGTLLLLLNAYAVRADPNWAKTTDWPGGFFEGARLQGTMPQPNVAALVFACLLVFAVVNLRKAPVFWGSLAAGSGAFIAMTGSRGGLVVAVGGLTYLLLRRVTTRILPLTATAVILFASVVPFTAVADAEIIHGRDVTWQGTLELVSRSPILGSGVYPPVGVLGQTSFYAHNQVLQTMVESGLVGGVLLLGALLAALRRREDTSGVLGWSALLFGLVLTMPFENPLRLYEPSFGFVPALFAMAIAAVAFRAPDEQISQPGDTVQMRSPSSLGKRRS